MSGPSTPWTPDQGPRLNGLREREPSSLGPGVSPRRRPVLSPSPNDDPGTPERGKDGVGSSTIPVSTTSLGRKGVSGGYSPERGGGTPAPDLSPPRKEGCSLSLSPRVKSSTSSTQGPGLSVVLGHRYSDVTRPTCQSDCRDAHAFS